MASQLGLVQTRQMLGNMPQRGYVATMHESGLSIATTSTSPLPRALSSDARWGEPSLGPDAPPLIRTPFPPSSPHLSLASMRRVCLGCWHSFELAAVLTPCFRPPSSRAPPSSSRHPHCSHLLSPCCASSLSPDAAVAARCDRIRARGWTSPGRLGLSRAALRARAGAPVPRPCEAVAAAAGSQPARSAPTTPCPPPLRPVTHREGRRKEH